jgi:hypothetical protein
MAAERERRVAEHERRFLAEHYRRVAEHERRFVEVRATAAAIIGYDPVVTPKVAFAVQLPLHAALLAADLGPLVNLEEGGGASQEAICEGVLANVVWSPALKDDEMKMTEFDIVPVPPPPGDHEGDEGPLQGGLPFVAILVDFLISVDYFKLTITHDKGEGKEVFARLCNRVREAVNKRISRSVRAKERMFKAWLEALQAAYRPQVLLERIVLPFVATLTEPPEKHRALYRSTPFVLTTPSRRRALQSRGGTSSGRLRRNRRRRTSSAISGRARG